MISRSPLSSIFSRPGWVFQPLERGGLQAGRKGKRGKGQTLRCTPKLIDSQSSAHLGASDTTPYWIRWSADSEFEKTKASEFFFLLQVLFVRIHTSDTYLKRKTRETSFFFHRKTGESEREREREWEREREPRCRAVLQPTLLMPMLIETPCAWIFFRRKETKGRLV